MFFQIFYIIGEAEKGPGFLREEKKSANVNIFS